MPLLPKHMLAKLAADARSEKQERDERGTFERDSRPLPDKGVHTMVIKSIESKITDKGHHGAIEKTYEIPDGKTASVTDFKILVNGGGFSEEAIEKNWKYLAKGWVEEFDFELPEADTLEELVKKLQTFVGRVVKVAVQHADSIWLNKKENKYEVQTSAYVWFTGPADKEMFFNASKGHRSLKASDQALVEAGTEWQSIASGGAAPAQATAAPTGVHPGNDVTPSWMKQGEAQQ